MLFLGCFLPYLIREVQKSRFTLLSSGYAWHHGWEAVTTSDIGLVESEVFAWI